MTSTPAEYLIDKKLIIQFVFGCTGNSFTPFLIRYLDEFESSKFVGWNLTFDKLIPSFGILVKDTTLYHTIYKTTQALFSGGGETLFLVGVYAARVFKSRCYGAGFPWKNEGS